MKVNFTKNGLWDMSVGRCLMADWYAGAIRDFELKNVK